MKSKFDTIIDDIHAEYCSACKKHPYWPSKPVDAVAILNEEVGESLDEVLLLYGNIIDLISKSMSCTKKSLEYQYNEGGSLENLRKELVQAGAMVVRCLINLNKKQVDLPNDIT